MQRWLITNGRVKTNFMVELDEKLQHLKGRITATQMSETLYSGVCRISNAHTRDTRADLSRHGWLKEHKDSTRDINDLEPLNAVPLTVSEHIGAQAVGNECTICIIASWHRNASKTKDAGGRCPPDFTACLLWNDDTHRVAAPPKSHLMTSIYKTSFLTCNVTDS